MDAKQLNPRLRAIAEALLCSSVPTQLLIAAALRTAGWTAFDESGQLSLPFVFTLSVADTLVLIALMAALTLARGERISDLWWGTRPIGKEIALGAMLIPVVFLMVVVLLNLLMALAPWLHNVPTNPLEQMAGTAGGAVLLAVVAILAGGVREELQRAFLLRRFEQHLGGRMVGLVVLSIAFGLGHIVQGFDAVITTGLLGSFWAALYLRRGSAVAPVISHAGFNTLEVVRVALLGQ
jgi:membrane protease YdiL (CAAX protease family)